jgi:hypothetical protein
MLQTKQRYGTSAQPLTHSLLHSFAQGLNEAVDGKQAAISPPLAWQTRVDVMFAPYIPHDFSQPHNDFWQWIDEITADSTPRPFIGIWPRNRGKSTHAEMASAYLLATEARRYCLYVCETQEQADKHIATVQHMLESDRITQYYPGVGEPRVGKHGSRSWRRSVMTAVNGATAEAIGLDKAIRGQKIDWTRPDLIIFDDIDAKHDTENTVEKKQGTITTSVLPAGAENCAVVFMQNLIHDDSIAHRLSKPPGEAGAADYLANRIVSGPHKAVDGLQYEFNQADDGTLQWAVTGGRSLWAGFDLQTVEAEINREGPTAFELESQHAIDTDSPFALLSTAVLNATRVSESPDLVRCAIGVDPSGGAGQVGIVGGGWAKLNGIKHGYTLIDYTTPKGTPSSEWGTDVLRAYIAIDADVIFVERNFGGDMAKQVIRTAVLRDAEGKIILTGQNVSIIEVNASRGKQVRAEPVASLFQQGKCHHVGYFQELQKQWTQWVPGEGDSPNNLDAEVWLYTGLGLISGVTVKVQPKVAKLYNSRGRGVRNQPKRGSRL